MSIDYLEVPWADFSADTPARARVSANFRLHELTRSGLAERMGIDNRFHNVEALRSAVFLCREVMQPVRNEWGPLRPNSVYRSQALERVLKGRPASWVSRSQHTRGEACDIEIPGVSNWVLASWIADNLQFDQLILECYDPKKGANSGWVHVSRRAPSSRPNRQQVLSYARNARTGRFAYSEGLPTRPADDLYLA